MNKKELIRNKRKNARLYPIYKMFSWDLLFYYSISFLFLTQTKGLTASLILFGDSFYPIFKMIFQIPCVILNDKIGSKNTVVLGNLLVALSILFLIIGNGLSTLIFSNLIMAVGYTLKENCEPSMIDECIPNGKKKNSLFSRLDGKGSSNWYLLNAISATITGFLFVFNNYLPMYLCFALLLLSTYLSSRFRVIKVDKNKTEEIQNHSSKEKLSFSILLKDYLKDLKIAFKFIFQSSRLRSLLIFSALFSSIYSMASTLNSSLLRDINIPEQYFGIIFAALGIISSFMSTKQNKIQDKYKNRTLTFFSIPYSISFILLGGVIVFNINYALGLVIIFSMLALQSSIVAPYWTTIKRYLNSFTTPSLITKIYSASNLLNGIIRFVFALFCSYLMDVTTTSYSLMIIGTISLVMFIIVLKYMKTRVGLKPEEYKKKDIEFVELK